MGHDFVEKKSQVFRILKEFKKMVEMQSGKHIKVLKSYRGGEYNSKEFIFFLQIPCN